MYPNIPNLQQGLCAACCELRAAGTRKSDFLPAQSAGEHASFGRLACPSLCTGAAEGVSVWPLVLAPLAVLYLSLH